MRLKKKPETIAEAKRRLLQEIEAAQSIEAFVSQTKELLKLIVAFPPENPEFYRRLKEIQDRYQKPLIDKMLLDMVSDN
jgi:hypothetical protein